LNWPLESIPSALRPAVEERLARLDEQGGLADVPHEPGAADALPLVWACSDFVADACLRDRELLPWLFAARRLSEPQELADLERDLESAVVASSSPTSASAPPAVTRIPRWRTATAHRKAAMVHGWSCWCWRWASSAAAS